MDKFFFQKGSPTELVYPLVDIPSPTGSDLVSPQLGALLSDLPTPTMPGDDGFMDEYNEVLRVRNDVLNDQWPGWFLKKHHPRADFDGGVLPEPLSMSKREGGAGLNVRYPKNAAAIVHMDQPWDLPFSIWSWLSREGKTNLKEPDNHKPFLQKVPEVGFGVTGQVYDNLLRAFKVKYFFGRPRPEEVSEKLNTENGARLTAYEEGCPCHPAYPAGHGAAAASVKFFFRHFDLEPEVRDVIFDSAYHWAMYRTFAGVHYADDNIAGLAIGGLMKWSSTKWEASY